MHLLIRAAERCDRQESILQQWSTTAVPAATLPQGGSFVSAEKMYQEASSAKQGSHSTA